jgi:hypothetical protein
MRRRMVWYTSSPTFRKNVLPTFSGSKSNASTKPAKLLAWSAYSSTLKTEAVGSSEKLVDLYQTTRCHITGAAVRAPNKAVICCHKAFGTKCGAKRRDIEASLSVTRGLISLWLYKESNKLRDWKKCIYSTYSPLSSTHLWLRCSNFFNQSKKNYFVCAANRKIINRKSQRLISTPTYFVCFARVQNLVPNRTGVSEEGVFGGYLHLFVTRGREWQTDKKIKTSFIISILHKILRSLNRAGWDRLDV